VALAALCAAPNAWAQATQDQQASAATEEEEDNDVVVTAQRREQSLLDVPISVSVFGEEQIEESGWVGARDFIEMTPNVFFNQNDAQGSKNGDISMRGITDLTSGGDERGIQSRAAIGLFVDDFSVASVASGSANPPLGDVERIEVLLGPQATYFGRNATGGAVNIVTHKPDDERLLRVHAGVGSFNSQNLGLVVNLPLAEDLFARGSISWDQSDGYTRNLSPTGHDASHEYINGRVAVRWMPGDWIIDATAQIINEQEDELGRVPTGITPSGFFGGAGGFPADVQARITCGMPRSFYNYGPNGGNDRFNCLNTPTQNDVENIITTLTARYDADNFTFTSITGRIASDYYQLNDTDNTGGDLFTRENIYSSESVSQEFRLSSAGDAWRIGSMPWDWTLGAFYYQDESIQNNTIIVGRDAVPFFYGLAVPGDHPNENEQHVERDGWAAFADLTFHVTDALSVSVSGRHSLDNDTQFWTNTFASFDCGTRDVVAGVPAPLRPSCVVRPDMAALAIYTNAGGQQYVTGGRYAQSLFASGDTESENFSPRLAANWSLTPNSSIYGVISTGYRPGGVRVSPDSLTRAQVAGEPGNPVADGRAFYEEETITNYELGFHGSWNGGNTRLDAAIFRMDWEGMQYRDSDQLCRASDGTFVGSDDPRAASCDPTQGFVPINRVLNAPEARSEGVELTLHNRFNEFFSMGGSVGYLNARFIDFTNAPQGDLSGETMLNSPEWSAALHAQTDWTMGGADWYARLEATHKSAFRVTFGTVLSTAFPAYEDGYTLVNFRTGVDFGPNSLTFGVDNITEEIYAAGSASSGLGRVINVHPRVWRLNYRREFNF
jgi:iron complex outermembrane receptor protein